MHYGQAELGFYLRAKTPAMRDTSRETPVDTDCGDVAFSRARDLAGLVHRRLFPSVLFQARCVDLYSTHPSRTMPDIHLLRDSGGGVYCAITSDTARVGRERNAIRPKFPIW